MTTDVFGPFTTLVLPSDEDMRTVGVELSSRSRGLHRRIAQTVSSAILRCVERSQSSVGTIKICSASVRPFFEVFLQKRRKSEDTMIGDSHALTTAKPKMWTCVALPISATFNHCSAPHIRM